MGVTKLHSLADVLMMLHRSCSDSGTISVCYITGDDFKDTVIQFNEPVKSICVETDFPKDKSFILGERLS